MEGICVHLWLIHFDVWHKSNQYCKAIINQLKINKNILRGKKVFLLFEGTGAVKHGDSCFHSGFFILVMLLFPLFFFLHVAFMFPGLSDFSCPHNCYFKEPSR